MNSTEKNHVLDQYNTSNNRTIQRLSRARWRDVIDFIQNTQNSEQKIFLDVGCGTGRYCFEAHTHGFGKIIGLDNSEKMLEAFADKITNTDGINDTVINRICTDIRNIKNMFDPESIDVIISVAVIPHLFDAESRKQVLVDMINISREKVLISGWSTTYLERKRNDGVKVNSGDYMITFEDKEWYYYLQTETDFIEYIEDVVSSINYNLSVQIFMDRENHYAIINKK